MPSLVFFDQVLCVNFVSEPFQFRGCLWLDMVTGTQDMHILEPNEPMICKVSSIFLIPRANPEYVLVNQELCLLIKMINQNHIESS